MPVTIDTLFVGDDPAAWRAAGFTVDDGACHLGLVTVRLGADGAGLRGPNGGSGMVGWSLRDIPPGTIDIDGLATALSRNPFPDPGEHPNGVIGVDHVVVATPSIERTTTALEGLGVDARRTRDTTSSYGAPMRQRFFKMGPVVVEVVGPPGEPDDRVPSVDDEPARFFGLALNVADLDGSAVFLGERLGAVKDAVQPGRRIATMRTRDLGISVPIALMTV